MQGVEPSPPTLEGGALPMSYIRLETPRACACLPQSRAPVRVDRVMLDRVLQSATANLQSRLTISSRDLAVIRGAKIGAETFLADLDALTAAA